jgi:predicted nicotinamide N-methyase
VTLRDRIRQLRLFLKSGTILREAIESPRFAWHLPFLPADRSVEIRFRSGRSLHMRAAHWPQLPGACRLDRIGARTELLPDSKKIQVDGFTLYSPLWTRDEAAYYREVLLDDAYGVKGRNLSGATVVDVGAYVGDSALAFARQGALVHAFEPSQELCAFIRRNAEANGLAGRVVVHGVGLAERDEERCDRHGVLRFVEGVSYALRHLPADVDVLKLDCEGAEYHLLADPRFLAHLRPREIRMEFHRGPDPLVAQLRAAGFDVARISAARPVGLLTATSRG